MHWASTVYKFIFVVADEITSYLVTIFLYREYHMKEEKHYKTMCFVNMIPRLFWGRSSLYIKSNAIYLQETWYQIRDYEPIQLWSLKPERHVRTRSEMIPKKLILPGEY